MLLVVRPHRIRGPREDHDRAEPPVGLQPLLLARDEGLIIRLDDEGR
jgi:hypothetical protein